MSSPKRQLGKNGPEVSALGFGLMGLSAFYGKPKPDEERFKVLDRALELGITFWDSADVYMDNEDMLGNYFRARKNRDKVFLATKFALTAGSDGKRIIRTDREYVKQACEKSLKRLGVDQIDLYYCHRVGKTVPIEETVSAMAELVKEGKIRYIGISECSADTLRRACKVHQISALQVEYSPFFNDIEKDEVGILKTARELGISIVAYSPLGRGMLTGRYKSADDFEEGDWRRTVSRYSKENFPKNFEIVNKLSKIAEKKGISPAELTLAWVMAQGDDFIPIPGTTSISNLEQNTRSLQVKVSPEEDKVIRETVTAAEGDRYPPEFIEYLFADTPLPK